MLLDGSNCPDVGSQLGSCNDWDASKPMVECSHADWKPPHSNSEEPIPISSNQHKQFSLKNRIKVELKSVESFDVGNQSRCVEITRVVLMNRPKGPSTADKSMKSKIP